MTRVWRRLAPGVHRQAAIAAIAFHQNALIIGYHRLPPTEITRMTRQTLLALALITALSACGKKADDAAAPATDPAAPADAAAAAPAAVTPAEPTAAQATLPADDSDEGRERTRKQGLLDYATMEDSYLNDAKGQWATSAKASSSFGDANKPGVDDAQPNTPWQATAAPNSDAWNNNSTDIGFDWLRLDYERPVKATAVRMVGLGEEAIESINKIELVDTDGAAHTVWTGLSDVKKDERGSRTWFVRTFEPTPYQAKSIKLTFANNVSNGYKEVDAVQLVGE